jgi:hypothetical protein
MCCIIQNSRNVIFLMLILSHCFNYSFSQNVSNFSIRVPQMKSSPLWDVLVSEKYYAEIREGGTYIYDLNSMKLISFFKDKINTIESSESNNAKTEYFDSLYNIGLHYELSDNNIFKRDIRTKDIFLNGILVFKNTENHLITKSDSCLYYKLLPQIYSNNLILKCRSSKVFIKKVSSLEYQHLKKSNKIIDSIGVSGNFILIRQRDSIVPFCLNKSTESINVKKIKSNVDKTSNNFLIFGFLTIALTFFIFYLFFKQKLKIKMSSFLFIFFFSFLMLIVFFKNVSFKNSDDDKEVSIKTITQEPLDINFVYSPDSSKVVGYNDSLELFFLWNIANGELIDVIDRIIPFPDGYKYNEYDVYGQCISFSPNSELLILGDHLFRTNDGKEVKWFNEKIQKRKSKIKEIYKTNFGGHFFKYGNYKFRNNTKDQIDFSCSINKFHPSKNIIISSNSIDPIYTQLIYYDKKNQFISSREEKELSNFQLVNFRNFDKKPGSLDISHELLTPHIIEYNTVITESSKEKLIKKYSQFKDLIESQKRIYFNQDSTKVLTLDKSNRITLFYNMSIKKLNLDINITPNVFESPQEYPYKKVDKYWDIDLLTDQKIKQLRNNDFDFTINNNYLLAKHFCGGTLYFALYDINRNKLMFFSKIQSNYGTGRNMSNGRPEVKMNDKYLIFTNGEEIKYMKYNKLNNIKTPLFSSSGNKYFDFFNWELEDNLSNLVGVCRLNMDGVNRINKYGPFEIKKNGYSYSQCQIVGIDVDDKDNLLITTDNSFSYILNINNYRNVKRIKHCTQGYPYPSFYSKKCKALVSIVDNTISLFDLNGKLLICHYYLSKDRFVSVLPNGCYSGDKLAIKNLYFVSNDTKVVDFSQMDVWFNRPGEILAKLDRIYFCSHLNEINILNQFWEKRIRKLNLPFKTFNKNFQFPVCEIIKGENIFYVQRKKFLKISIRAKSTVNLRTFNILINEVPLYSSAGISIAQLKKQVWDTTVIVPLSVGENKIQVSVMNELGLENFKYPTYVNYTPSQKITSKTYYIGIGVNEFKESSHNLKYCVKDVSDLAQGFGGPNTEVKLFTNHQVTKENILALKEYLNKTTVNDKVIISCSSHGLLDDSLNFYLAMHDVDFKNPKARGLKYEELESLLDGIPARQKLLLLDACNSGENDKTEVLKKELEQKQVNMNTDEVLAARGAIVKLEEENKSNFKKMNELFVNVRNNTGSVIISAAGGQESALEAIKVDGETIENGAFTFSILECLEQYQGKELKVNTLKQFAEKRVEEITNGRQKPTSRQETMEVDWGVR